MRIATVMLLLILLLTGPMYGINQEAEKLYEQAQKDARAGKMPEAISKYEKALTLDPEFVPALNDAGYCYVVQGNCQKAIEYLTRADKLKPKDVKILNNLANAYYMAKNPAMAMSYYEKVLSIDPGFHDARRQLGLCFLYLRKFDQCTEEAKKLIEAQPREAMNRKLLIQCYMSQGKQKEAVEECTRAIADFPEDNELKTVLESLKKNPLPVAMPSKPPGESEISTTEKSNPAKTALITVGVILVIVALVAIIITLTLKSARGYKPIIPQSIMEMNEAGMQKQPDEDEVDDDFDTSRVN